MIITAVVDLRDQVRTWKLRPETCGKCPAVTQ